MKILKLLMAFAALGMMVAGACGQTAPAARQLAAEPQLVFLDTDIGDDIDDAFALALALHSPELRLLGVRGLRRYGVCGRGWWTGTWARWAGAIFLWRPGFRRRATNHLTQAAYALQVPERKHADGVEFLLGQIREHPGQITLISIGPLNNVRGGDQARPGYFSPAQSGWSLWAGAFTGGTTAGRLGRGGRRAASGMCAATRRD